MSMQALWMSMQALWMSSSYQVSESGPKLWFTLNFVCVRICVWGGGGVGGGVVVALPQAAGRRIRPTAGSQDLPRTSLGSNLTPSPLRGYMYLQLVKWAQ